MKKILFALALFAFPALASAQTFGPTALDVSVLHGSSSTAVELPNATDKYPALMLLPAVGTATDIRWTVSPSGDASSATSTPMPAGGICYTQGAKNTMITTFGVTTAATLHVVQLTMCPQAIGFAGGGGGGGGGGGAVTIAGPVDSGGNVLVNCAVGCGGGFVPSLVYGAALSVTSTSATPISLPAGTTNGSTVKVYNQGPNIAWYTVGVGTGISATTNMSMIPPNSMSSFTVGPTGTAPDHITAIAKSAGQTATLTTELGTGSPNDSFGPYAPNIVAGGLATNFGATIAGADNGGLQRLLSATAPGTAGTGFFLGIQGCPTCIAVPMSAASLPLPTGAATSANQPALVTPGQTNTSQNGNIFYGAVSTAVPSRSDGTLAPASIDPSNGGIRVSGGNVDQATLTGPWDATTTQTIQIVAAISGKIVKIISWNGLIDQSAAGNGKFGLVAGTGVNCATSQVELTHLYEFPPGQGLGDGAIGPVSIAPVNDAVCVRASFSSTGTSGGRWAAVQY